MAKYKLEYIWLDGYEPVPNLRGKTQVKDFDAFPTLEQLPMWGFDGSSTRQAEGHSSDCLLKPVAVFPDPTKENAALVMCEVMMPDGKTSHPSNSRATILDDPGAWFSCTGTQLSATVVLTAGHCTHGTGKGGVPTDPHGGGGIREVDDHGGGEARILLQLILEVGLEQLQRPVGIARLHLREIGAPDLIVGLQHRAEILFGVRVGEPDSRAPVVLHDHRPIGEHDLAQELADRAVAPGAEGVDVANSGAVENERVDAALPKPALQRLGPFGERRLIFARSCHAVRITAAPRDQLERCRRWKCGFSIKR